MFKKSLLFIIMVVVYAGAQSSDYMTIEIPVGAKSASNIMRVKWVGTARPLMLPPDSGKIYFSRFPGGAKIANYKDSVTVPYVDTVKQYNPITKDTVKLFDTINNKYYMGTPPKREIAFRPAAQKNMGVGVFYCIIAWKSIADTQVSNEFQVIVESPNPVEWIGPSKTIEDLTPTFSWKANTGVPYYHIILSDEVIKVDTADGEVDLQGLSIIWQAITSNTQMVYGAPDPSGTITADPPPLSPGQQYTWLVLNNYGNHAAFSSARIGSPGEFTLAGVPLKAPKSVYPVNDSINSINAKTIKFKWTNLDTMANTYQIYLYVGSEFEGINAQLVVYQTEVMAVGGVDTLSVDIEAASVLTTNRYVWKAIAIDDKGAGTVGDTVSFKYVVPACSLVVHTCEQVRAGDAIVTSPVGLVEIKIEVLDGSMEAPLLYYTDLSGKLARKRPVGSFRLTAKKDGYDQLSKTINMSDGEIRKDTFFLVRPEATIYGKVLDAASKGINLAKVTGVSDRGDTVTASTDALGNFVLNCYPSDWRVSSEMSGYKSVLPVKVTVISGEHYSFGSILMEKNPYSLSGVVKNSSGLPLLGAKIRIYQDGTLINEIPSTPQSGTFSFTIPAGTYTLTGEKTGFTSYSGIIDVLSSSNITITMPPGAALVTGYIRGKTWIETNPVYAPITNANIKFVNITKVDSFSVTSDNTYGDFKISLPGAQTYLVYSSAQGYVSRIVPCTLVTQMKTTQVFMDTLQGYGIISGEVRLSTDASFKGNVTVNCINISNGEVAGVAKTSASGYYEIKNLIDANYIITAGYDGLVLDSIVGPDTVKISNGKATPFRISIYMKPGDKQITWSIRGSNSFDGTVKIQSPLNKTLSVNDTLKKAGHGTYVINCDAKSNSIIDLSYHRFSIAVDAVSITDTLFMDLSHTRKDTIVPVEGKVTVSIHAADLLLDSVKLFYKDAIWSTFKEISDTSDDSIYNFTFLPPKDGSVMQYYFKAWRDMDVYGYDKELFSSYIAPDLGSLSKFEILPSSWDTLTYPSGYTIAFSVKGYYSSSFIPAAINNPQSVSWALTDAQGCVLEKNTGLEITVKTGSAKAIGSPVLLTAIIDTTKTRIIQGTSNTRTVPFRVSGTSIKSIEISRVDAEKSKPVTTSPTDRAEFKAVGVDNTGFKLTITPTWSIDPVNAGTISSNGVFKPSSKYIGNVRIFAQVLNVSGEYTEDGSNIPGLNVQFMITNKSTNDTASSNDGCRLVFPAGIVKKGDIGIINKGKKSLKNMIMRSTGRYKTIDSTASEFSETENISFDFSNDSIRLIFDVPDVYVKNNRDLYIARWDDDSLKWDILTNSIMAADRKTVSAGLTHFSSYAIMVKEGSAMVLEVNPNPFSPFVRPGYPREQYSGTCFKFQMETNFKILHDVNVRIYNIVGDLVWSLFIQNANNEQYKVWWDGRASEKELIASPGNEIYIKGDKMCRNGRYFVVVTARDAANKEHRLMKQIVLMK